MVQTRNSPCTGINAIVDGPFGSNLKRSDYIKDQKNGVPVLTTKNLEGDYSPGNVRFISKIKYEELKRSSVKSGDILVAKIGSVGKTGIYPKNSPIAIIPANLLKFTVSSEIVFSYVYAYLNSFLFQNLIREISTATAQPAFNVTKFRRLPIPVPPINEQHRIVAKIEELFSELDKGIESLKTAREQLKVYRQAVLKHAFEGRLTAKWREENKDKLETADQLFTRIKKEREAHYQQQLEEWRATVKAWEEKGKLGKKPTKPQKPILLTRLHASDLPELPLGWIWVQYGALCSLIRNGISKKPVGTSGKKIFRISAVRPMEFDLDDVRYISDSDGEFANYYLQHGDLVFTRYNGSRNYVGVCAQYQSDGSHLYPDKLIRTQLGTPSVLPGFIEKAANCGVSRHFIEEKIRTTAGQSGISGSDIKSMPVPLCNTEEQDMIQNCIEAELSNTSQMLFDIDENICRSESLRQSILKKAFFGQLVEQDPNDEPASVLLERIEAEKAKQAKPAKKKKRKTAA